MFKLYKNPLACIQALLPCVLFFTTLLGAPTLYGEETAEQPPLPDFIIYEIQEGDTLRNIAEKHLGGAQYILELMEYNEIANPNSIGPQSIISIPTRIRQIALEEIRKAENSIETALEAMADKFAKEDYLEAINTLENARTSRAQARYDQAIAFARLTAVNARLAKEGALRASVVQLSITLKSISGTVDISSDAGVNWLSGTVGQKITSPATIRTGGNSVAVVLLDDGSTIRVNPDSVFSIARLALDRRTKKRETKLRVLLGEIIGNITPQDTSAEEKSDFNFETDGASIAIRGTNLRVNSDANSVTRVSVYEGKTEVSSGNKSRSLNEGFGIVARKGKKPSRPINLPPSPSLFSFNPSPFVTFEPHVSFEWKRVKNRWAVPSYHIEIARDTAFFDVQVNASIASTQFTTAALKPGRYYARLSAVDKHGLNSSPSNTIEFEVKRDIAIQIKDRVKPIMISGKPYVMSKHGFSIESINTPNSIDHISYTINKGLEKTYHSPLMFSQEGEYHIAAWAVGRDGKLSDIVTRHTLVDLSPPTLKAGYQFFRKRELREPIALVQITAEDQAGVKFIEYNLNDGPFINYVTPFEVSLFDNTHMKYRATDLLGQISYTYETIIPGQKVTR